MIVTIDGPAGAGKSTVARELARRLGFRLLDTGAMYRAVALAAVQRQLDWDDPDSLVELARESRIELSEDRVLLDGQDVSAAIRTHAITSVTHYAANNPLVRAHLVELQRQAAGDDDIVCEGRDQGTVVFPHAQCKIYLTASPLERARRRAHELASRGEQVTVDEVLAGQTLRDRRDATRVVGRLTPAADAIEVCTDGLSSDEVVSRLEDIVRQKMRGAPRHPASP
jgi:cytidylate kinase/pantoate ligase/cytidylate kinase